MIDFEKLKPFLNKAFKTIYSCSCTVGEPDDKCLLCSYKNKTCSSNKTKFAGFVDSDVKVYCFDTITTNYFHARYSELSYNQTAANDVIVFEENGEITFIEFKSGKNIKLADLRDKILSSIYFLSNLLSDNDLLANSKNYINYILVYNKNSISILQKGKQPENYEDSMIVTGACCKEEMNDKCTYFGLNFFKDNVFKNTLFYDQEEFIDSYVKSINQIIFYVLIM